MYFEIPRKDLLTPLRLITSVIEQRQTLPVLGNVLVVVQDNYLHLTGTDAEVEITCKLPLEYGSEPGSITIPARKWSDICRSLGEQSQLQVMVEDQRATMKAGRGKFTLSCLPADDFPNSPDIESTFSFSLSRRTLRDLIQQTQFAMAAQDVRYYLNGMLMDLMTDRVAMVATDGHRLAMSMETFELDGHEPMQVIMPRKAIVELSRILDDDEETVIITLDSHHVRIQLSDALTLTSKLIDGRFPDYHSVIPQQANQVVIADCTALKQALARAAILSNEKFKGIRLGLSANQLKVMASNPENEEAEEEVNCDYEGEAFEIGFNVTYLLDALSAITTSEVELCFSDPDSSCLIQPREVANAHYVIMPMRL